MGKKGYFSIRRLRISHRLTLLGAIVFGAITFLISHHLHDEMDAYEMHQHKLEAIQQIQPIYPIYQHLLKVRDSVHLFLYAKAWTNAENEILMNQIERLEEALDPMLSQLDFSGGHHLHGGSDHVGEKKAYHIRTEWEALQGGWRTLEIDRVEASYVVFPELDELDADQLSLELEDRLSTAQQEINQKRSAYLDYKQRLNRLIEFLSISLIKVAENNHLIANESLDLLYMAKLMVEHLPEAAHAASVARSQSTGGLVKKRMSYKERSDLGFYYGELRLLSRKVNASLSQVYEKNSDLSSKISPAHQRFNNRIGQFSDTIEAMVSIDREDSPVFELMGAQTVFAEGERAIDTVFLLNNALLEEMRSLLNIQANDLRSEMIFTMVSITLLMVLLLIGGVLMIRSITQPVARLIRTMEEITANNDYSKRIEVICEDEVGALSDAFNKMSESIEQSNAALLESKQEVEQASLAKDEFLASMSHELRTPLTVIIGNSEILGEQAEQEEMVDLIHDIEVAGRCQLALVNDILDMSKIESGKFTIEEVPYNLDALLHRIQSMLSVRAQDAGLSLSVELMSEVQYKLIGDSQRIGQILINLVSNAIKFTKQGRVSVKSWLDEERLYFQVIDSGIGMSSDVLQRLFSRFEQADGSISRRFGGSGLGLFISKSLAELMEGEIKVASQEGVGSTFTLILPYQQSDLPVQNGGGSQSDANQVMQQEPLTGHILLAEDTPLLQRLEQRSLEGLGLQVTIAKDGEEAVALASSHNFDLILMDMQMPVMDGIQATKVLREQGEQIPVIALTANVMQKHRDQFHEAGCDAFLGKPIDQYELYQALQMFLSKPMDKPVERTQESDGAGLMPIEWGAQFSVGHALMDRQHQLLVDHINLLIEYSNKPSESARQVMLEVLPKLNEYAARHFRSEEALLARVKYPALESQVAGHEQYGRKIASFYAGKMDQQQLISLIEFLTQWWKHHILIEDMLYKELISSLSVSEQVDEALDTALS